MLTLIFKNKLRAGYLPKGNPGRSGKQVTVCPIPKECIGNGLS